MSDGYGKYPVNWLFYEHFKYMPFDSALLLAGTDATDIRQELTNVYVSDLALFLAVKIMTTVC